MYGQREGRSRGKEEYAPPWKGYRGNRSCVKHKEKRKVLRERIRGGNERGENSFGRKT